MTSTGVAASIGMSSIVGSFFGRGGPVYISPLEVIRNLKWFRIASRKALSGYENAVIELGHDSLKRYIDFFKREKIEPDLVQGIAAFFIEEQKARSIAAKTGAQFLGSEKLIEAGFQGFGGAAYMKEEFSINPLKLYDELQARLLEIGVKIRHGVDADLLIEGKDVSVRIDGERLPADNYVVTAGSWSSQVLKNLKYNPQIIPARGLVLLFDTHGETVTKIPALLEDYGIVVSQHSQDLVRISSFFEIVNFKEQLSESRKEWLLRLVKNHVTKFSNLTPSFEGVGFRPCTPDQLPVIGRVPRHSNVFIASGNCRLGMTLAPATANIIRSMIDSSSVPQAEEKLWKQFDPARFG